MNNLAQRTQFYQCAVVPTSSNAVEPRAGARKSEGWRAWKSSVEASGGGQYGFLVRQGACRYATHGRVNNLSLEFRRVRRFYAANATGLNVRIWSQCLRPFSQHPSKIRDLAPSKKVA